jgi:hypothetical protein
MRKLIGLVGGCIALLLGGCGVTNPPLMFGDVVTYGLRLGTDESTGGGSVALGFKAQSVAIVPVTYLDGADEIKYLNGQPVNQSERDGMSVFASFESHAPQEKIDAAGHAVVELGQIFSTGLAAQAVTRGYVCRQTKDDCAQLKKEREVARLQQNEREERLLPIRLAEQTKRLQLGLVDEARKDAKDKPGLASQKAPFDVERAPYQKPLLFARTDVIGIDIGGSLAQQGLQFVLGYSGRNLALIPTTARNNKGEVASIMSTDRDGEGTPAMDAFSVLGQFKANTEIRRLGFGLERYFATGYAARNLGDGLGAAIAQDPPKKSPSPPDATGSTTAAAAQTLTATTALADASKQ